MERRIYSIRDVKIQEQMNLVILKNTAEAERYFIMAVSDTRGPIAKHPKDYAIYDLGGIETETGAIVPIGIPKDVTPHSAVDRIMGDYKNGSQGKHQDQGSTGNQRGGVPEASGG